MSWPPNQTVTPPTGDEHIRTPTNEVAALSRPFGEEPIRLGKYELLAKIGSGGMATVHIARQRGLCRFEKAVVVKTIRPQFAEEQKFIDMFVDEARISALLKHPNCVDVYDVGCDGGVYFIAMEHLAGQAFKEVLKAGLSGNPLDVASSVKIVADAAEALDAAHNLCSMDGEHLELVHRDVSPANIMVTYDGRVKLLDFGISKARGRVTQTVTKTLKGKLAYMAPEIVKHEHVDRRADIFSLGVVMWEALALRPLFRAANEGATLLKVLQHDPPPPSHVRPAVSPALDAVCLRALARDPRERYQTAAEMRRDLLLILGAEASFSQHKISSYMNQTFSDRREREEHMLRGVAARGREPTSPPRVGFAHGSQSEWSSDEPIEARRRFPLRADTSSFEETSSRFREVATPAEAATPAASAREPVYDRGDDRATDGLFAGPEHSNRYAREGFDTDVSVGETRVDWLRERVGLLVAVTVFAVAAAVALGFERATDSSWSDTIRAGVERAFVGDEDPEPGESGGLIASDLDVNDGDAGAGDDSTPDAGAAPMDSVAGGEPKTDESLDRTSRESKKRRDVRRRRAKKRARKKASRRGGAQHADQDLARQHYEAGQREFFRGDMRGAREEFLASLRAARGFAPAYRGLGLVFERQGKKRSAQRAFTRYLRLSPNASDASSIRRRLEKL